MQDKIVLYSYRRCPFAMRVRIALHEKKIPFEIIEEDLKNFSSALKALHPEAKVPLLVHGDTVIYESAIITEYVDDLPSSETKLMLENPKARAEARLWTYWCNHFFKPDLDRYKYGTSRFREEECVGAKERLKNHLGKLEARLSVAAFLLGERFTLADVHVFPFVRQLSRIQPTPDFLIDYSAVSCWAEKIYSRAAVILAIAS